MVVTFPLIKAKSTILAAPTLYISFLISIGFYRAKAQTVIFENRFITSDKCILTYYSVLVKSQALSRDPSYQPGVAVGSNPTPPEDHYKFSPWTG